MLNMLIALVRRGHELDPQQITHLIGRKFKGARQLDRGHVVGKQVDEGTVELAGGEGIGLVHGIDRHEYRRVIAGALEQQLLVLYHHVAVRAVVESTGRRVVGRAQVRELLDEGRQLVGRRLIERRPQRPVAIGTALFAGNPHSLP